MRDLATYLSRWPSALALVFGPGVGLCGCTSSGADLILYGTLYDVAPAVLYSDPAGLVAHHLREGSLGVYVTDTDTQLSQDEWEEGGLPLTVGEVAPDSGEFVLTHPELRPGLNVSLVVSAPDHAPTVFTGEVPDVSAQYPLFAFFDGALFSEQEQVLADRVAALSPERVHIPDPKQPNNGGLIYGQLLEDPTRTETGEPQPVANAQVAVRIWAEGGWQEGGQLQYLNNNLEPDPELSDTSSTGIFYLAGCPAGLIELTITLSDGSVLRPFYSLSVEDGMTWLAAFYVVER